MTYETEFEADANSSMKKRNLDVSSISGVKLGCLVCFQTLGTLFTDVVKARQLGSRTLEQFRHLLTTGGNEWFIYSIIKVMPGQVKLPYCLARYSPLSLIWV